MTEINTQDKRIFSKLIEEEIKISFMDYSMSVIVSRALPDVRDGLKPVHRRILYAMNDLGLLHNRPFKKSARIVGEVLGKYHPHGDTAVYDSMVRMAQNFSLRYPLVRGQGNFGSIDGDRAAAMRYTEAKLQKLAEEMLQDINKETVKLRDNFDSSLKEPTVLPAKVPNLLINGSTGIAVGMATNIPPHNLNEVVDATIKTIDNPEIEINEIVETLKGPDFPTAGIIQGRMGILQAYTTGHGKIKVKGKSHIEEGKRKKLIITEIPYLVNKSLLVEEIANHVKNKKIEGISDLRDESDRTGMRIVIELKMDANSDIVLNQIYKHTRLETTFGANMLALVNNEPQTLNIKQILEYHIKYRQEIIRKRTEFDLKKAEARAHILEGLKIALLNIDKSIKLIKKSKSAQVAIKELMDAFNLTNIQSQAILDMKLQRLTSLEQNKIKEEHANLLKLIEKLNAILESEEEILNIIKTELIELKDKYGDKRRTEILEEESEDLNLEDLIKPEEMVVTISHAGYIKRVPLETYKEQKRGGKGVIAARTKEEDFIEDLFIANTHSYVLFFTNRGTVHWLKVYRIPSGTRQAKGKSVINLLEIEKDEKITTFIPIREFKKGNYLVIATKKGIVKKSDLIAYSRPRKGGIKAMILNQDDNLINVRLTNGERQLMLATKNGKAIKFHEKDARSIGRNSKGVRGIMLKPGDEVIDFIVANDNKTVLTVTEKGYGKRTKISDYRLIKRGGFGVINIICNDRNGKVVSIKSVDDEDSIMFISQKGNVIRTLTKDVSTISRNTQGVRIMRLADNDKVVAGAKVINDSE